jgi:hypothetical protein
VKTLAIWRRVKRYQSSTSSDVALRQSVGPCDQLYWKGFDKQGHPVLVWNAARHDGSEVSAERYDDDSGCSTAH